MTENPEQEELLEEHTRKAYVAGMIDSKATMNAMVMEKDTYSLGYKIVVKIRIIRSLPFALQVVDDYALDNGVHANFYEDSDDRFVFQATDPDSILRFFEGIYPYMNDRVEEVDLICNEIIPALKNDDHLEKETFLQLVDKIDMLRELNPHTTRSDRDLEYFEDEWDMEL